MSIIQYNSHFQQDPIFANKDIFSVTGGNDSLTPPDWFNENTPPTTSPICENLPPMGDFDTSAIPLLTPTKNPRHASSSLTFTLPLVTNRKISVKNKSGVEKRVFEIRENELKDRQFRRTVLNDTRKKAGEIMKGIDGHDRVAICGKFARRDWSQGVGNELDIEVSVNSEHKAKMHNVIYCDDIHLCPVCHNHKMKVRKEELVKLNKALTKEGCDHFFLTMTNRHTREDSPEFLYRKMAKARNWLNSNSQYQRIWRWLDAVGRVRVLETTFGINGFHVHDHSICYTRTNKKEFDRVRVPVKKHADGFLTLATKNDIKLNRCDYTGVEIFLKNLWCRACLKVGLGVPSLEHGLQIDWRESGSDVEENANRIADYLTKQSSICAELTGEYNKEGSGESRTMWQLLGQANRGCSFSADVFKMYAKAVKGENKIVYTADLKSYILNEDEDEIFNDDGELIEPPVETKRIIIDVVSWKVAVSLNRQIEFMECIEIDSINDFKTNYYNDFINELEQIRLSRIQKNERLREHYRSCTW